MGWREEIESSGSLRMRVDEALKMTLVVHLTAKGPQEGPSSGLEWV